MASQNVSGNTTAITELPASFEKTESNVVVKNTFFSRLTEDWWAVVLGGVIITATLLIAVISPGFKFSLPSINGQILQTFSIKSLPFRIFY